MPLFERATRLPLFFDVCKINSIADKQILDFGGNSGNILKDGIESKLIEQSQYTCLDVDIEAIKQGQQEFPQANWIHHNAYSPAYNKNGIHNLVFPFEDNSFDYIFSYSVHSHTTYEAFEYDLKEMHRVLKPGGKIATSIVDPSFCKLLWNKRLRDYSSVIDFDLIEKTRDYNYFINNDIFTKKVSDKIDVKFFITVYNLGWLEQTLLFEGYDVIIAEEYARFHQPMVVIQKTDK